MNDPIRDHQQLCDEIHQCVLDENRFLRQHQRAPDAEFLTRKRQLLERLDVSLGALRSIPAASIRDPERRDLLEKTRARILQVLQLDKENEQLLLRLSLGGARPASASTAPTASVAMLQKIYSRCS
ncbi:hypothetical protein [Opitutus sp. ER46]|uniref:hypothetical protein n=1 Tax=Opitutus sp. ER46 TaxID=2161864 RepID=UPI000D300CB3|nr:hypothetical protein [Opitutus sp. ER46]PTX90863.1 hypothetical protein DB354_19625 [Opitutus sp. ER46]